MAAVNGGKGKIHHHPKHATNTFRERPEDINRSGANKGSRKIKDEVNEILNGDGKMIIAKDQVLSINEDGSVTVKIPTRLNIAMKIASWAMSKQGQHSMKAIELLMKQEDESAPVEINVSDQKAVNIIVNGTPKL